MIVAWVLLLVSLGYVGLLFGIAYWGDRRPLYPQRAWLRPIVYSLALAVYCSSWTFYGAVGTAAGSSLGYLPIYLGPILLFVLGMGLLDKLVQVGKQQSVTSIADFIGSRFGKSHGLAALVTVIAITAAIPYLALQLRAVAMSIAILSDGAAGAAEVPAVLGDSAFYTALLLAAFAILFGTRRIDATEHHHGMMLAIAVESLVKLVAFVAVGFFALRQTGPVAFLAPVNELAEKGLPPGFIAQTLLGFVAIFCLPRQFQVGVVECEDTTDLKKARWIFPIYLLLFSIFVLPIAAAGLGAARGSGVPADAYLLWLPLTQGHTLLALFAYVGGFSAATGMVIVASVALSTMVSNDLVMPMLLRWRALKLEQRANLSSIVLGVRRIAIVVLALLAYTYYRFSTHTHNLAAIGLLAFAAVGQFAPAIVAGLYWRGASRTGVIAGMLAGFALWTYTLLLPNLAAGGLIDSAWMDAGPLGLSWLRPQELFQLRGWNALTHGVFWSLLTNIGVLIFVSLRWRPSLDERLSATNFLDPVEQRPSPTGDWRGRVRVGELHTIAARIVGARAAERAFADYLSNVPKPLATHDVADRGMLQFTERLLASAIGAASARRVLMTALRGTGLDMGEAVALLDEASQELRFNRELMSSTLENIAQGVSVVDAAMRLVAWNRRYLEMFQYPDGMVYVGRPVADLIRYNASRGDCGVGEVEAQVNKRVAFMQAGSAHVYERVRADGTVIELRGNPLPGGGFVTTFSDVTAYKHAEQALREANETLEQRVFQRTQELSHALAAQEHAKQQAEAANQSKTRFLAAASHDLLQPLNAARLFTSALRHQSTLDAESTNLAERIDAAFKAAEDLIDSLLQASRLEAGRHLPEIAIVSLHELIEPLRHQFNLLAQARGLRLRVVDSSLHVRSDPQLLRRIVQNFLSNALRYTRTGSVLLGVRRVGTQARIEVWDTGPGIASELQGIIFEEFQRLQQPSPWGEKGLGLGLSICDRMAQILGHPLTVRSRPGQGSVFAISVPIAPAVPLAVSARIRPQHVGLAAGLHVLCLDNDPAILDGMAALLSRWGISCALAGTVAEARAAASAQRPDLILADYHLSEPANGLDALEAINAAATVPIPAALVTADHDPELKLRVRDLGYALLRKPVKPAALRALIAQLARPGRSDRRTA